MRIVDRGAGTPLVLIPGIQGRWQYLREAVVTLSTKHRVLTCSLPDERQFLREYAHPLDGFVSLVERLLDERGIQRAVICGVSFGGRIALRFAAQHPARTMALVLASTPGPHWHLRESHRRFAQSPWLSFPAFLAGASDRMRREVRFALPRLRDRVRFFLKMTSLAITAPSSPARMAARALMIDGASCLDDCALVRCPTLVLNGEPELDHVVPVDGSSEYHSRIANASTATLTGTGHQGPLLRPAEFARIITEFIASASPDAALGETARPAHTHDAA
jgi:pimeloyl-ACP methyl ester carboxylesterase